MKDIYNVEYVADELSDRVRRFIERWHYSKSYRSLQQKHVFQLTDKYGNLVGVAVYGNPMSNKQQDMLELRRLCLVDDTPKNTESYFIGATLRWLAKHTEYEKVISFADPNHGHHGTIYKASNFLYDGLEKTNPRVVKYGDKYIHLRQMYQKKEGDYSEDAKRIQSAVAAGEAQVIKQEKKHRYIYELRR